MAKINSTEQMNALRNATKINTAIEMVPNNLSEDVVSTIESNFNLVKPVNIYKNIGSTATGTDIVYSIPTNQDFYLTGLSLFIQENVTSDNTATYISATINGASVRLISFRKLTLTASTVFGHRDFSRPIKIDRGTNITVTNSFAAGAATKEASICGYTDDSSNA